MGLEGYQVELREVTESDLQQLRNWRNQPGIQQMMISQQYISEEQQRAWYKKIQRDPSQQHFVVFYKGTAIGSANIKSCKAAEPVVKARVIEPGLYIGEEKYRGNILSFAPTLLLNDYCFYTLKAEALRAVVKKENIAALHYNQKLGYRVEKQGDLIDICLNLADYEAHSRQLKAFLSR